MSNRHADLRELLAYVVRVGAVHGEADGLPILALLEPSGDDVPDDGGLVTGAS